VSSEFKRVSLSSSLIPSSYYLLYRAPALRPEEKPSLVTESQSRDGEEDDEEEGTTTKKEDQIFNELMTRYGRHSNITPTATTTTRSMRANLNSKLIESSSLTQPRGNESRTGTGTTRGGVTRGVATATESGSSDDEKGSDGGIFRLTSPTKREL
jgi:hypothetical protein